MKLATKPQPDRQPIRDYESAVWRLAGVLASRSHEYCGALEIVADIYWVNDEKVRADVARHLKALTV